MKRKNTKSDHKKGMKEKTREAKKQTERGLAYVGFASILWLIYSYSSLFPLFLLWIQGWNMAYPERAVTEATTMTLAKIFIVCTIAWLVGRHVFNVRKTDLEEAID